MPVMKPSSQARAKQLPVQIQAVAANIQTRTLKTEAGKSPMRTAAAHGLADRPCPVSRKRMG